MINNTLGEIGDLISNIDSNNDGTLDVYEICTFSFGALFILSEFVGSSKCKQNSLIDLFLELFRKCKIKQNTREENKADANV
jgi:hypothetical protein